MLVVLDTSVIVAGLRSSAGASAEVLKQLGMHIFQIAASPAIFLEYEEVLKREEHRLPPDRVEAFLSELATVIYPVQIHFLWRPQLSDADDELVLETAINGRVRAIVTHNKRDFERVALRFGIEVWSPAELLQNLRIEKRE
jgi:putative PIN family toxin of toxin-antitoxin system